MLEWLHKIDRQKVLIFAILIFMIGLVRSRALLSIGTVLIVVNALTTPHFKSNLKKFWFNKAAIGLTSLFFIIVFSGLFSENSATWLERVRIKIPYLLLPYAFVIAPSFGKRQYYGLLYFFMLIMSIFSIEVLFHYLTDVQGNNAAYAHGGSMPTPIIYVRFSLFLAFAIVIGAFLWIKKFYFKFKWERYLIAFTTIALFIFLHVLAVRTGIFALYNVILLSLFYYIFQKRQLLIGFVLIALLAALPFVAYQFLPSFHNKIDYMVWDLQQYQQGNKAHMASDYMRLVSIENGWRVMEESSYLFGTGAGDLRDEMNKIYEAEYPTISKKLLPHNQYIFALASTGFVGLLVFIFATLFPIFYDRNYLFWFFVCFHITTFSSFLAETTIELQIGNSFYLLFLLLSLNYLQGKEGQLEKTF